MNMAEESWSSVDSTPLDEDDLSDTIRELSDVVANWRSIGILLGIRECQLEAIHLEGNRPLDCLRQTLATWLRRNYNVKRFGEPTWMKLVEVVSHSAGGGNRHLAMKIARRHGDQPGIGLAQSQEESGAAHYATAKRELVAKLPIQRLGSPIKIIEGVSQPWGMAVKDNGEIVVAEYGSHCISIFTPNGKRVRTFGTLGSAQGQFYHPIGVAIDSAGNIIVVDGWNHRIQKFTAEGKFLTGVGRNGCAHLEFNFPAGIGINPNNKKVYVCDCHNHRVQILNEDLTFTSSFGNLGSADGHFNYPWDVAFDNTGSTYIADSLNNRIQVFMPEGKFLRKFGKQGSGEGELNWPSSISIDLNDRVYVADREVNHRVSTFTSQGEFIRLFGTEGGRPGEFNYPHGIAVDKSGLVYVSNCNNHRVEIFECQHSDTLI